MAEQTRVFPTHVGVYLHPAPPGPGDLGFPHARGGVPGRLIRLDDEYLFSPRTWGCT